jgi:hypothetical protein
MDRMLYQPTEKQTNLPAEWILPSDEDIKAQAKRQRRPWGLLKRDLSLKALRGTHDYTIGIWQGRVDAARGTDYSEERFSVNYNLGYHDGYLGYQSDRHGWDVGTRERFDATYLADKAS